MDGRMASGDRRNMMHSDTGSRNTRLLLMIVALGVTLRLVVAVLMGDRIEVLPGIQDQVSYDALAQSLLAGTGFQFPSGWYPFTPAHTPTAHWSFAYPVYLAAIYRVAGYHPLAARLVQAVLAGILLPYLTYLLGARFFGRGPGLAAAALTACYGYFIYHNAALMTETFYMLAVLFAFHVAYDMVESGSGAHWWGLGLAMAAAVLLRQVYLLFVPVLLLWMALAARKTLSLWRLAGAAALVFLCIVPWSLRNFRQYDAFLLLNSNSGYALYTANHPDQGVRWNPDYVAPIPSDLAGTNEAQMDRALTQRAAGFVVADPQRYLRLVLSRIPYQFRFWPTSDSGLISNIIRVLSFGLYLPFMLAGFVISRHQWRRLIPIYLFALLFTAIHVLSWPSPRYRFPVDAVNMIFAGLALATLLQTLRPQAFERSNV